ncbi:MAG: sugar phosphate isomerase/epimerase family protein [Sphingomicrobium sp.]
MTQYSLAQLTVLDASPPELIRLAREAGYDFVGLRLLEVTGGDAWPLATDAQLMREAKAAMSAYEIGVLDVELVRLTPEIRIEELRPTLEAAAELGVKHILTQAHDSDWARLVHNFGTLCDLLAGYGMTADIEFLTWTQMRGVNEVMRLLNAANRTNVGITVDTLHFHRSGCTIDELRAVPAEFFHFIQICDAPAVGPSSVEELIFAAREDRLNPGAGGLDLAGVLRALPADVAIAVEIPNSKLAAQMSDQDRARQALEATKALVETVSAERSGAA